MCKKFKCDHTTNGICKAQPISQKMAHINFFWDFDIQTDHLILARIPDFIIINKKIK